MKNIRLFKILIAPILISYFIFTATVSAAPPDDTEFAGILSSLKTQIEYLQKLLDSYLVRKSSLGLAQLSASLSSGLVGHWKFDEGAGTTVQDSSGSNNAGTLQGGPAWINGKIGKAIDFANGSNQVVKIASSAALNNLGLFSISAWINPRSLGQVSSGAIITKGNSGDAGNWRLILNSTNALRFSKDFSTLNVIRATSDNTLRLNQWQHVVVTGDGSANASGVHLYVNGIESSYKISQSGSGSLLPETSANVTIGNTPSTGADFDGAIDEVRIYNRILSASEVSELFSEGSTTPPPPPAPSPAPAPTPASIPLEIPPPLVSAESWILKGGTLSAYKQGWAFHPAITTASDGTIYAAWTQHTAPDTPFNPADFGGSGENWEFSGIRVKKWNGVAWDPLGGRIGHVQGATYGGIKAVWPEAYHPSIAVLGSTPYVAWYEGGGFGWGFSGGAGASVFVAHWDAATSAWVYDSSASTPHGALNTDKNMHARDPVLAVVSGVLYAAWVEARPPPDNRHVVVVKHLEGGVWQRDGGDVSITVSPQKSRIIDVAIADVGGIPHVAISGFPYVQGTNEITNNPSIVQVYKFAEGSWTPFGGSLTSSGGYSNYLSMTVLGNTPYVTWQEKTTSGNYQIYAKRWTGSAWVQDGSGILNVNPSAEAGRPAITNDGTKVWLAWTEGLPGQKSQLYTRSLSSGVWSSPEGSLNVDSTNGAPDYPALAVSSGISQIIWAEKHFNSQTKQVYVKGRGDAGAPNTDALTRFGIDGSLPSPFPTNTWVNMNPKGIAKGIQSVWDEGEATFRYSTYLKKALVMGKYHAAVDRENQNALLAYDFEKNRWDLFEVTEASWSEFLPGVGHDHGNVAIDPVHDLYITKGSFTEFGKTKFQTYVLDLKAERGKRMIPPKEHFNIGSDASAFDPEHDLMLTVRALGPPTFLYNHNTNEWKPIANNPPRTRRPGLVYDTRNHIFVMFGGERSAEGGTQVDETWTFDPVTKIWKQRFPSVSPPAVAFPYMSYDSANGVSLFVGGALASGERNRQVWVYDAAAGPEGTWTKVGDFPEEIVTTTGGYYLAYDSDDQVFLLFGTKDIKKTWAFKYVPPSGPTLFVSSFTASPSSGTAPLNDVDLTASVGGTATGPITYTFYCNRPDSGTDITPGFAAQFSGEISTTKTATDVCDYPSAGSYSAKVIVQREGLAAEARTIVTVNPPVSTGSIKVKRVGHDDTIETAPAGTQAKVDSGSPISTNPADFTLQPVGSHTIFATDVPNFTETAGHCTFPVGGTECLGITDFSLPVTCSAGFCSVTDTVSANQVTKVVFKYLVASVPTISVAPTSLSFSAIQGDTNIPTQTLTITKSGPGSLSWTVSDDALWLTVIPTSDTDDGILTVTANPTGKPVGIYTSTITITPATGLALNVSVSLTISTPGMGTNIPILVTETQGVARQTNPVTAGIPLPPGTQTTSWSLWEGVTQIPLQVTALPGRTPWILLDFQSSPGAGGTKAYILKDTPSTLLPVDVVTKTENIPQGTETVTTGPLEVTLKKTDFNLFETVFWDRNGNRTFEPSEQVVTPQLSNLSLVDAADSTYSGRGPSTRWEWEYQGSLRATLRVDGKYGSFLDYTMRLTFYAGRSDVRIEHILRNSDPATRKHVKVKSAVIRVGSGAQVVRAADFGSAEWQQIVGDGVTYELIPCKFYIGTNPIRTDAACPGTETVNNGLIIPDRTHHGATLVADFADNLTDVQKTERRAMVRSPLFATAFPEQYSNYGELSTTHFSTMKDERDFNQNMGWTVGNEPSRPAKPDEIIRWQDVHDVTEADALWGNNILYVRSGEPTKGGKRGYWDLARAWARYYKFEYAFRTDGFLYQDATEIQKPAEITPNDAKYLNKVRDGKAEISHLYGWGLVDYYYLTGDKDALGAAKDLGEFSKAYYGGRQPGVFRMTLHGERLGARSLLLATRLAEADSGWQVYMDHLAKLWLESPDFDPRGFHYRGKDGTDNTIVPGAYAAGARQMIPFEQAFLTQAFDRYYTISTDPDLNPRMRDRIVALARWIQQYALHPTYQYGSYHIAMDWQCGNAPGQLWRTTFDDPGPPCTPDGAPRLAKAYTYASVDTLVRAWRLTGDPALLNRAKLHWERGSKAISLEEQKPANHIGKFFDDSSDLSYASLLFYDVVHADLSTLSVGLTAVPSSGIAPLNDVDLTASVFGTVTGPIDYHFYCNRLDIGVDIGTPTLSFTGETATTKTATDLCDYTIPGTYTAKTIVVRGGLSAQDQATIIVDPSEVLTGAIKVKRVGHDDTIETAPPGTQAKVDAGAPVSTNPADFTSQPVGSHTILATDVPDFTETAGHCYFPIGGTECLGITDFSLPVTCSAGFCSVTDTVSANQVTKVVFKYLVASVPTISVAPTSLSFSAIQGDTNIPTQTLTITKSGPGSLSWTVSDNALWLTVIPTSGTDNGTLTVTANPSGKPAGTYTGIITITPASGPVLNVSVTMTIAPVTDTTPPDITNIVESPTATTSTISFTTSEPATSKIEYGITPFLGTSLSISLAATTTHTITLTGLIPDTQYFYKVSAKDASNNERISTLKNFRTLVLPDSDDTLDAIHVFDLERRTSRKLHIRFEAPDDTPPHERADRYELRYRTDVELTKVNWDTATSVPLAHIPKSKGEKEFATLSDLACGQTYSLGIRARKGPIKISDLVRILTVSTKACPPIPRLITFQFGSVILSWSADAYPDGDLFYRIIRVTGTTPPLSITDPNAILIGTTTQTTIIDSTTAPSTTYTYAIASYADEGEYSEMTTVQVTTPAPPPPPPPPPSPTPPPPGGGGGGGGGGSSPTPTPAQSPVPTPLPVPGIKYFFSKPLYPTLRDPEVAQLQRFLISKGHLAPGNDTGFFGPLTLEAVKKFQCEQGIVCGGRAEDTGYGLVGRLTRAKLNQESGITNQGETPPALTEPQRQALITQLKEQIKQLTVKLLELQLKLLQEQLQKRGQ